MELTWTGFLARKHSDGFRKHILFWSVPKHIREHFRLADNTTVEISVDLAGYGTRFPVRLFGGGEFKVPEDLKDHLVTLQAARGTVSFQLHLDQLTDPNSKIFRRNVEDLSGLPANELRRTLPPRENVPEKIDRSSLAFVRNPVVVVCAIRRARGRCEACGKTTFKKSPSGEPYLEVHHIVPLSLQGYDSLENVIALCPECHRLAHFGFEEEWREKLDPFLTRQNLSIDDLRLLPSRV